MLRGDCASVLQVRDRDELRDEVVRFTHKLGFETVSAITVIDHGLGKSEFINIDNTPENFVDVYASTTAQRRDPVMQHCKRASVPIVWNQDTYVKHGLAELWEQQARFGYRNGIALALHLPEGKHFLFGVDRPDALPEDPEELQRVVADLQLYAVHAQDAAFRILVPTAAQPERPALTPREIDVLAWSLDGKTAWEVGQLLNITERTVNFHMNNCIQKLGCVNKQQAVLKALRLGLIH